MNVLITGATGYTGFNVAQAFRRAGNSVIGLVLDESQAAMLEKNEIRPLIGNLWQPETYRSAAMDSDDLATGYLLAAESITGSEIFHFSEPTQPTVRELVSAITRVTGFTGSVHYLPLAKALQSIGPNAEAIAPDLILNSGKAQRVLGWKARHVGFILEAEIYFASWKAWRFSGEVVHATS